MPRRFDDEDDEDDRPIRRRRRGGEGDEDDNEEDDGPRRRRREGDATGGLIPYKNAKALAAYYCAIFSLIPCVGAVLGPIAVVLGFLGLKHANQYPEASGKAHAYVGVILGGLTALLNIGGPIVLIVVGAMAK